MGKKKKKKNLNIEKPKNAEDKSEEKILEVEDKESSRITADFLMKAILAIVVIGAILYFFAYISHKEPVIIGVPDNALSIVVADYLQTEISEEFGVSVQLKSTNKDEEHDDYDVIKNIGANKFDIHPAVFEPVYQSLADTHYKVEGDIIKSKSSYSGKNDLCMIRSVATRYDIDEVEDLSNKIEKAEMWLGEEGGQISNYHKKRSVDLGYFEKFDLNNWTEEEAIEKIKEYEKSEEPFIFACYSPSRIALENIDSVVLDDDKEETSIHIFYSSSLEENYPEIVKFINQIDLTEEEVNKMIVEYTEEE